MSYRRKIVLKGHADAPFDFGLIACKDGFEMSVQAKEGAYCSPRDANGPYTDGGGWFPLRG